MTVVVLVVATLVSSFVGLADDTVMVRENGILKRSGDKLGRNPTERCGTIQYHTTNDQRFNGVYMHSRFGSKRLNEREESSISFLRLVVVVILGVMVIIIIKETKRRHVRAPFARHTGIFFGDSHHTPTTTMGIVSISCGDAPLHAPHSTLLEEE